MKTNTSNPKEVYELWNDENEDENDENDETFYDNLFFLKSI
jgi:hypothetical protein